MTDQALGTLAREEKGVVAPPPALDARLAPIAAIGDWPGVAATTHWGLYDPTRVDGIDFYVGATELGHVHLDGSIHLATTPALGAAMIAEGVARPFRYQRGWVCENVATIGPAATLDLFRRNYDRIVRG